MPTKLQLDRREPPAIGRRRPFQFPAFDRRRLAGGMEVLLAPSGRMPLVRLALYTPAGGHYDPAGRPGLATLTASLLDEGSETSTATEIAARMEQLGGGLQTAAGWNAAVVHVSLLAQHLEAGLDIVREVALTPTFPAEELERLRRRRLAELLQHRNEPSVLAERSFSRAIYGSGVYGQPLNGDEASTESLARQEVVDFYEGRFVPAQGTFIAAGNFDPAALGARVEALFGAGSERPRPALPELRPPRSEGVEVVVVNRPGASQTELRVGHVGVERNHPDFTRLEVMNSILGGKFTSRINLNLRERHGYTYGAHSRFVGRLGPGPFQVSTAVATEHTGAAVAEILGELERIRQEAVEPEELSDTRSYLRGTFVYHMQTVEDLTNRLVTLALYGLPDDHFETYLEAVAATTREQVLEAAREHLHPECAAIVAVGPADQLAPQLERFGELSVVDPREKAPAPAA